MPKKVVRGSVSAGLSALDLALLMAEKRVSIVVLVDGGEKPVGIYTESDVLNHPTNIARSWQRGD